MEINALLLKRFIVYGVLLLSIHTQGAMASTPVIETDVIILGAGIAGITAARELNQQGVQCILLEARDRIGGRIHTVHHWGTATDLGASWIHKIDNNPLVNLVQEYNIPVLPTHYSHDNDFSMLESATIFDGQGKKMNHARFLRAVKQIKEFKTHLDQHTPSHDERFSVQDALREYTKTHSMNSDSLALLVHINGDTGEYENGANIADTSYKVALNTQSSTSGVDVIFTHGYSQLLSQLTQHLPIFLNQIVTKVVHDSEGVTVYTQGNRQYKGKYLISTLPLGVLKSNTVQFIPELPKEKKEAIQRIGMGVYNKAYLLFDKVFWNKKSEWILFLSKKKNSHEDFEVMNYFLRSKRPILVVFTTGDFAQSLEKQDDQHIIDRIMTTLRKTYGPQTPYPTSFLITRWGTDPFAKGSFSYPRIGSSNKDYALLAKPVNNRLFFAGEATSMTDPSTVTGAYLSGIRAAKEVAALG